MNIKGITIFIVILLLGVSCGGDNALEKAAEQATLTIAARSALTETSADPDYAFTSFRVMVFRTGSYVRYNETIDLASNNPFTLKVDKGLYDFVFIANEDSDESLRSGKTLTQMLDDYAGRSVGDIENEYFSSSSFRNDCSIPMTAIFRNVEVQDDNKLIVNGVPVSGIWDVEVEKAGIRVDLFFETSYQTVLSGFEKIDVIRVPAAAYFFDTDKTTPKVNVTGASSFETYTSDTAPIYRTFLHNEGDEKTVRIPDPGNEDDVDYMLTPANLSFVKDGDKWYWYKRIILPYSAFTPVTNSDYGIQLRATVWGKPYLLTLSNQAETDFTISRNSRYKVNANLSPNFIQFEVSVLPWGDNTNVDIPFN